MRIIFKTGHFVRKDISKIGKIRIEGKTVKMNIQFLDKERIFKIDTEHTSYVMAVMDDEKFLEHVYFGRRVGDSDLRYMLRYMENPFLP